LKTKPLSPIAIVALGTTLTGVVPVAVVLLRVPVRQASPGIFCLFLGGAAVGVLCFGSLAFATAVRVHLTQRTAKLMRRALAVTSPVALMSMGYLAALCRHGVRNSPTELVLSALLAFVGTLACISLATALRPAEGNAAKGPSGSDAIANNEGERAEGE
jgi:hypothetical protein